MTADSPKGPECEARPEKVSLRDRIAQKISAVDGHASSVEPCGDATYEQMADAALTVMEPEYAWLSAEVDRQHRLAGEWCQKSRENGRNAESFREQLATSQDELAAQNRLFRRLRAERDEALAALEKQQALLAAAVGACSCNPTMAALHESGSYCGDPQYEAIHELLDAALVEANLAGVDDRAYGAASRAGDLVLKLLDLLRGTESPKLAMPVTKVKLDGLVPDENLERLRAILRDDEPGPGVRSTSPVCGAQEGMTGIRCCSDPGHQDQHSGRYTPKPDTVDVVVNIQWDRASWDTCAPANPVWVSGNREPGPEVQAVTGRMTGRVYRRETEHFGGAWFWGPERGQWVVWERLLESERVAEAEVPRG